MVSGKTRGGSEDRKITNTAAFIMTAFAVVSLSVVWIFYYNGIVFRSHKELGCVISLIVYLIIYLKAASVYSAFKIASMQIGEGAFSQCIALGFADAIIYIEGCLIARCYINIFPGLLTVIVQFVGAFIWATKAKQYFLTHVEPQKCVLIYAPSDAEPQSEKSFVSKMKLHYGHLFDISRQISIEELSEVGPALADYPIVFLYEVGNNDRSRIMEYCINTGKKVYLTPNINDVIARGFQVKNMIDTPLYAYESGRRRWIYNCVKRVLDIVVSLLFLLPAAPIMLVTALCIKLEDHGAIFFRQERCTIDGKVFHILKFRSMVMNAEKDGKPLPCVEGDDRVTKVGRIIRATRIDELPQIFNILSGNMSLVGPRPERVEHVELYTKELPEFSYRLRVKAGLTGYAQIYGKYNTSAHNKLLLDLLYIEQQSLLLDIKIIFLTVRTMFTSEATEGFDAEKAKEINEESNK